jgi:hypothetical protein
MRKTTARRPTPHEEALQNPQSRRLAIRAKCWDCEGQGVDPGWQERVRTCVIVDCPLWHVRPYRERGANRPSLTTGSGPPGLSGSPAEIGPQNSDYHGFSDHRMEAGAGVEPGAHVQGWER